MSKKFIFSILFIVYTLSTLLFADLNSAWREVEFKNYKIALKLFDDILQDKSAPLKDKIQSKFAKAMINQFKRPNPDMSKAEKLHAELFFQNFSHFIAPASLLQLGRIYDYNFFAGKSLFSAVNLFSKASDNDKAPSFVRDLAKKYVKLSREKQSKTEMARAFYKTIIENYPDATSQVAEATLRLALTFTDDIQNTNSVKHGIQILEAFIEKNPDSEFTSVMMMTTGNAYCDVLKNYKEGIKYLIGFEEKGILNFREQSAFLFKIAVIAQNKLNDYSIAEKYYNKILNEQIEDKRVKLVLDKLNQIKNLK